MTTFNTLKWGLLTLLATAIIGAGCSQQPRISGTIRYSDGTAAADVVVSDGFSVVKTNRWGKYSLKPNIDTWYIYYSIPSDCKVPINELGQPHFFAKYDREQKVYDFTLTKSEVEEKFTLFCLADPQCKDDRSTDSFGRKNGDRFQTESVPAIKAHAEGKSTPCYGVTLGDIVYSEDSRNNEAFMVNMRDYMVYDKIGMPLFQTIGNHDYTFFFGEKNPLTTDSTSSTYNIKAQRAFEAVFGPIDYSWNRGQAHIISMRNIQWNNPTEWHNYTMKFTDSQLEWLKKDLSFVDKDKLIIFCVHIPLMENQNANTVIDMLKQFPNCHIMSGHAHFVRNEPTISAGIYEHVHAAVSGQWWWSNMNGDGVPNGYGVYEIEGNKIVDWYHQGINEGMNSRDYQIRIYRGDLKCGDRKNGRTFDLQHGSDIIIANVFNADIDWKVEIFEDGVSAGIMEPMPRKMYYPNGPHDIGTTYPVAAPTDSGQDWWSIAYHIGVIGRSIRSGSYHTECYHLYRHKLKNPKAKDIRVEATDRFGNVYSCSEVLSNCSKELYPLEHKEKE